MPRTATSLVKILVAVLPFYWLIASGRLDFSVLFESPPGLLHLSGLILLLIYMIIQAMRWWWLLLTQNISIPLKRVVELSWISNFFTIVLPGTAGGELVRAYYIVKDAPNLKVSSVSTVLVDRILGLYSLLWLGVASFLVLLLLGEEGTSAAVPIGVSAALLTATATVGLFLLWMPVTRNFILRLLPKRFRVPLNDALNAYQGHGRYLAGGFILSLVANICYMGIFLLVGLSLNAGFAWHQVALSVPFIVLANTLPISPGGVGVGETASSLLFEQFDVSVGAEIMLVLRLWTILLRLPGGVLFLFVKSGRARNATG